ncbi:MAG: ribonuclease J [bacterium]
MIIQPKSAQQHFVVPSNPKIRPESESDSNPRQRKQTNSSTLNGIRVVPLGGLEEIGRNMMYIEYKDEIVIIDMGFQFPEEETPGIDYIIPNITSLIPKKDNIKAIVLTHAHFDHIGAVPYLSSRLGNPPIYTQKLTKAIVEKRQEEFVNVPKLNITTVQNGYMAKVGKYFEFEFFEVSHTVPDTTGVIIKTPIGNLVYFADFRIDYTEDGKPLGLETVERIGKMGVHTFMADSTNAEEAGQSVSEKTVEKNLAMLFKKMEGRIILATFSSMITRIGEIMHIAEKMGRKVAINGRSMKNNIQIARNLGYIKVSEDTIIPIEEIHKYKDKNLLILSTGAQGESNAGLMRIVSGEHRHIQLKPGDGVVFSSSVIPGNERSVQSLKDNISRQGASIYHTKVIDIHASGHATQEDIKTVVRILKPDFFMPVHGHYYMRVVNCQNAIEAGVKKENVRMLDNGSVAVLSKQHFVITDETVPAHYVMVDGLGVGDVGEIVLRDRKMLAQEGMIVIIVTLDRKTGRVLKNPDIISRGFIYLKDNQDMLKQVRQKIRAIADHIPRKQQLDADYLKSLMRDQLGQFLYNKTYRRPMVLPVVIEV